VVTDEEKGRYVGPVVENLVGHLKSLLEMFGLIGTELESFRDVLLLESERSIEREGEEILEEEEEERGEEVEGMLIELEEAVGMAIEDMKRGLNRLEGDEGNGKLEYDAMVRKRGMSWIKLLWP
jgi:hypothetical protein